MWFVVVCCRVLLVGCCLFGACRLLVIVVWRFMTASWISLFADGCCLFVVYCVLLFVVGWLLFCVWCLLIAVA